jgi:hypothetical protein
MAQRPIRPAAAPVEPIIPEPVDEPVADVPPAGPPPAPNLEVNCFCCLYLR